MVVSGEIIDRQIHSVHSRKLEKLVTKLRHQCVTATNPCNRFFCEIRSIACSEILTISGSLEEVININF